MLKQPGIVMPYIQLVGTAPAPSIENVELSEQQKYIIEDIGDDLSHDSTIPVLTVFSHSKMFDQEMNPAYGVDLRMNDNMGVGEMRAVVDQFGRFLMQHTTVCAVHLNLLVYDNVTGPSKKLLRDFLKEHRAKYNQRVIVLTIFSMCQDLQWNILNHKLILPHRVLSNSERRNLVQKGIHLDNLPRLVQNDKMSQIMALVPGEVVQIDMPLDTLSDCIYRQVVRPRLVKKKGNNTIQYANAVCETDASDDIEDIDDIDGLDSIIDDE